MAGTMGSRRRMPRLTAATLLVLALALAVLLGLCGGGSSVLATAAPEQAAGQQQQQQPAHQEQQEQPRSVELTPEQRQAQLLKQKEALMARWNDLEKSREELAAQRLSQGWGNRLAKEQLAQLQRQAQDQVAAAAAKHYQEMKAQQAQDNGQGQETGAEADADAGWVEAIEVEDLKAVPGKELPASLHGAAAKRGEPARFVAGQQPAQRNTPPPMQPRRPVGHPRPTHDPNRIIKHGSHTHTQADAEAHSGLIFGVLFGTMIVSQVLVMLWKRYHERSFNQFTLFGLWVIPGVWSLWQGFWRMLLVWTVFSLRTGVVLRIATRQPVARTAPHSVYSWFYFLHRVCYGTAVAGYVMVMMEFFGVSLLLEGFLPESWLPIGASGITVLFYGLYFGVLGRDLALMCTTSLASKLGYYSHDGLPSRVLGGNTCAICDLALVPDNGENGSTGDSSGGGVDGGSIGAALRAHGLQAHLDSTKPGASRVGEAGHKIFTLTCGHRFHEYCIRGWTIIGKKATCAYCNEKVNVRGFFQQPWEQHSLLWGLLLDTIRYVIVFNPLLVILCNVVLYIVY